jgi:hypothetical protein
MIRRLQSVVVVAAASSLVIAGCGGGSSPSKTTSKHPTPAATTPAQTTPSSTPSSKSSGSQTLKAAAANCAGYVARIPSSFGSAARNDASTICTALKNGNAAAAKADVVKFCSELVASIPPSYKALAEAGCAAVKKDFASGRL